MKGFILEVKSCCVLSIVHSVQVKMMKLLLVWMMIFMFHTGSSQEILTQFKDVTLALEGDDVTLSCNYSGSNNVLFWYQQKSSSPPQLLIMEHSEKIERLTFKHDKTTKEFHLQISSAAVTDSAVYYCALRNTGYKLIFGSGTRLSVEPREEYEPSYYKVGNNETKVCLATGFSRHNATEDSLFNETKAVRISGDSLYNQAVVLSSQNEQCEKPGDGSDSCESTVETDPTMNLASLTVLGLRLLFIKTIVFNVLMTFRLWISQ